MSDDEGLGFVQVVTGSVGYYVLLIHAAFISCDRRPSKELYKSPLRLLVTIQIRASDLILNVFMFMHSVECKH